MTINSKCTDFDDEQLVYANEEMYLMISKGAGRQLICAIPRDPKTLATSTPKHAGSPELHKGNERTLRSQSTDTIRINTNRNVSSNIRSFLSNKEPSQDQDADWDPLEGLAGLLSDYAVDKDVLETLDELRDRFGE